MGQFKSVCLCIWTTMTILSYNDFSVVSPKIIEENRKIYDILQKGEAEFNLDETEFFFIINHE